MTIVEKYTKYLRYEKNYSSHTEISYYTDLCQFKAFLESHYCGLDLVEVDSDIVRSWIVFQMDQGLSASSVNRKLSALKSFYRFLQKIGEVKTFPLKKIKGPKTKKPIPSFVGESDMNLILDVDAIDDFSQIRNQIIVELFYMTGIRRAELIALKDENVDFNDQTVKVLGKRNKERVIPLSSQTASLLRKYRDLRDLSVAKQCNSFFVKADGLSLYPMLVYRIVNSALRWVPTLKKASPHVLRHSFATGMLNNLASINSVKEILGHTSLASTEIYTHTSFEELKKAYNQAHPRA